MISAVAAPYRGAFTTWPLAMRTADHLRRARGARFRVYRASNGMWFVDEIGG